MNGDTKYKRSMKQMHLLKSDLIKILCVINRLSGRVLISRFRFERSGKRNIISFSVGNKEREDGHDLETAAE